MGTHHLLLGACLALGQNAFVLASDANDKYLRYSEQTIVTGTSIESSIEDLSGSFHLLSEEQIIRRNKRSTLDLLRQIPGLQISQQGGRGGVSTMYLRGGEPNFTMVLVDGIEVNDPTNSRGGSFDFSMLQTDTIGRIEIVHGPQSATYGSGSLAGAINVVTRVGAEQFTQQLELEFGDRGTYDTGYSMRGPLPEGGYTVSIGKTDSGVSVPGVEFDNEYFNGKLKTRFKGADLELVARYGQSERAAFPEDSGGPQFAVQNARDFEQLEDLHVGARARWALGKHWTTQLRSSWFSRQQKFESPGILPFDTAPPRGDNADYSRTKLHWLNNWQKYDWLQLGLGADAVLERGEDDAFINFFGLFELPTDYKLNRKTYGQFFEARLKPASSWTVNLGLRNDKAEGQTNTVTNRAGLSYSLLATGTNFHINYGQGFKLPSFFALGNAIVGNPDLKPERSENYEIGLTQNLFDGQLHLSFDVFRNKYRDLVDFDSQTFRNVNRNKVIAKGADLSLRTQLVNEVDMTMYLSYLDTQVVGVNSRLRGRPRWHGGASFFYPVSERIGVNLEYIWNHTNLEAAKPFEVADENPAGYVELAPFSRVDVSVHWNIAPSLQLKFAIDNVLDQDYQEAVGFPSIGFEPRIGVQITF
ncbi:MAG: TonB-dependent receptor plug domain-containing protein [Pseudomonadales bacterium]